MENPTYAIIRLANVILNLLTYAIIAQAVFSWIQPDPRNRLVQLLHKITDPILGPIDRVIPPLGGINISPLVAIVLLQFIQTLLPRLLL